VLSTVEAGAEDTERKKDRVGSERKRGDAECRTPTVRKGNTRRKEEAEDLTRRRGGAERKKDRVGGEKKRENAGTGKKPR